MTIIFVACFILIIVPSTVGRDSVWQLVFNSENDAMFFSLPNYMYDNSFVSVTVVCDSNDEDLLIYPVWILKEVECMQDMYNNKELTQETVMSMIPDRDKLPSSPDYNSKDYSRVFKTHQHVNYKEVVFQIGSQVQYKCGEQRIIKLNDESVAPYYQAQIPVGEQGASEAVHLWKQPRAEVDNTTQYKHRITTTWGDGMYHLLFSIAASQKHDNSTLHRSSYTARVYVEMRSTYGYLSAINWPLLPYSGVMSVVYLLVGTVWVCLWIKTTLHTEKIHIFIGAVAVAGALTNTLMFVDMASTNSTGTAVPGLSWLSRISASIQSCLTSALLMVVSTGYGITRPTLHKRLIVAMSVLTGVAIVTREAVVVVQDEALKIKYDYPAIDMIVSGLYLFTMLFIAAFIMIASILTFQHLRKRQHSQQVVLFCCFMVTCIIGFIAELVMFAVAYGWFSSCRKNWKMEWIIVNFGSVETLVLLIVLMWLWRPVDRSQSYAFYPLKTEEDAAGESDEDIELFDATEKTLLDKGDVSASTLYSSKI